ncbi:MAG: serpin family protein [Sphingobacteriia bacterium]|nr:serpin family protein [Sphingobacteriia bacterium]
MKTMMFTLFALILLFLPACEKSNEPATTEPLPIQLPLKASEVIQQSNAFGLDLFKLTDQADTGNMMLSPLSAATALTMLLNGCEGETYDQIQQMLGFTDLTITEINDAYKSLLVQLLSVDPEITLTLANALFYHSGFMVKQPFLYTLEEDFSATVKSLDFSQPSALGAINAWADDKTNGKISKVLDELSPSTVMILMNALYFMGNWTYRFDKELTVTAPFYTDNGNIMEVSMMQNTLSLKTFSAEDFSAVELPYGRTNFSMIVILPDGQPGEFVANLNENIWEEMTAYFDNTDASVEIIFSMPKFKFAYEKALKDQLIALGMTDAFDEIQADLGGISDEDIFVSFVKQNTFIDVNEEGTEAAAVTTIGFEITSAPVSFTVNRPFVFAIRERTSNALLFIGKVMTPQY